MTNRSSHVGHPYNDPAIAVELTLRERQALMTSADWELNVDRLLATPADSVLASDIDAACNEESS